MGAATKPRAVSHHEHASQLGESGHLRGRRKSVTEVLHETKERVVKNIRDLCHYHELEPWRQDNQWIHTGYRITTNSYALCFRSLLFVHNETGNIVSHLGGGLVFLALAGFTFSNVLKEQGNWLDAAVFLCFFLCSTGMLVMSGLFHLFSCHSLPVSQAWNKCDYVGIMLMIVGSCFPSIYYAFHCHPWLQLLYLAVISTFGAASVPILTMNHFSTPKYRPHRTILFVGLGLSGIIPMSHGILMYSWEVADQASSLTWTLVMGFFYLFGALLYATQFPERKWPGRFDLWLNSHQIFHLCVLAAAVIHFLGLLRAYSWHKEHPCHVEPYWHSPPL